MWQVHTKSAILLPMISLYDLLESANGQLFGEPAAQIFTEFCLDAQEARESQIFVARRTDQGDTHQYIEEAIQRGVSGVLCTHPPECDTTNVSVIMVRNPDGALMSWAHFILGKMGTRVIAVAGSSGKTVTAEALSRVLSIRYRVHTGTHDEEGPLSIPLSLARLTPEHEFAILKLGIAHPGEMADMVQAVQPSVGIVTSVDYAESADFQNREQVAQEYGLLVEYLSPGGLAVLNYDDDHVQAMEGRSRAQVRTVSIDRFGADLMAFNVVIGPTRTGFDLRFGSERHVACWVPLLGKNHLYCVLAALLVGAQYEVPMEDALRALKEMTPLPGRMRPLNGPNGGLLIDDTYDANTLSTLQALDWLEAVRVDGQRVIFAIGDMDNLGRHSQYCHRLVGSRAAGVVDHIVTLGPEAALVGRAALDQGMDGRAIATTYSLQDVTSRLQALGLNEDDIILIKGGASLRMEQVVQALLADENERELLVQRQQIFGADAAFQPLRPSWVEIDGEAIAGNVRTLKATLGPDVGLMAVVKADAYGHGAVSTARTAVLNGADYLAVASIAEALELRGAGIDAPILVLSYTPVYAVRQAMLQNITVALYDLEMARAYDRAAREVAGRLKVHVKIDSGMGRLGVMHDQAVSLFRSMMALQNIEVEGIYTHFAAADDPEYTARQMEVFRNVLRPLRAGGFSFPYVHAANSGGVLLSDEYHQNMVRVGIMLYGLRPSPEAKLPEGLRPVLSWKTVISQVRSLPPDYPVGYGNTYWTRDTERIAIIPVGYADGLRRSPQTWREVLVHGQRAPLVGRVSMEKTAINVSHIPGVSIGDEVVLLGRQGDDEISADEVAEWLGTINYEVVTSILPRVPRR